jgi:CO dehydrogenase/acetyl-CoA synthase beta subunit
MTQAADRRNPGTRRKKTAPGAADMAPLIARVRSFLDEHGRHASVMDRPMDEAALAAAFGYRATPRREPQIVLEADAACELGHPMTPSRSMVLVTCQPIVRHGRVTVVGPDLEALQGRERQPLAQVVMLACRPGKSPDPFDLERLQFLTNRLPGYMVRSVPGRLWVRVSRLALGRGLNFHALGSALVAAYARDLEGVEAVEVLFVTSSREAVEALARVAVEADILAGRHRKLFLTADGGVECSELDCESCEEKEVCDSLRDIVIRRRAARSRP